VLEAEAGKHRRRGGAAHAGATDHDHVFLFERRELVGALRQIFERNEYAAGNVTEFAGKLVVFRDIEQERVRRTGEPRANVLDRELTH